MIDPIRQMKREYIYICFSQAGRSVLGETVLEGQGRKTADWLKKFHCEHALAPSADHMQMQLVQKR